MAPGDTYKVRRQKSRILHLSPSISLSELLHLSFLGSLCAWTGKAETMAKISKSRLCFPHAGASVYLWVEERLEINRFAFFNLKKHDYFKCSLLRSYWQCDKPRTYQINEKGLLAPRTDSDQRLTPRRPLKPQNINAATVLPSLLQKPCEHFSYGSQLVGRN